ncbi:MAG: FliI/YscN family ATPase [Planctomycetes bacterium]|nr:FliI/YscN family ATPase [Planctomycetota bacterium]
MSNPDQELFPSIEIITGMMEPEREGRIVGADGVKLIANVPDAYLGELYKILRKDNSELLAEVIGFDVKHGIVLMPLGDLGQVSHGAPVRPLENQPTIPCGESVRGRIINALGAPIDKLGELRGFERTPLFAKSPNSMNRARIDQPISTGIRSIDALLTIGRGQRVGLFAAAGVGKSTLLGMIAQNIDADRVVVALIGERGREVREFIEDNLGKKGLAKSTVVVSTSDEPALLRLRAAYTATAIAEAARAKGERVVLLMDSVTRFARALREVGLANNEPTGRQGFPASVFSMLPGLFERAGNSEKGSITAFYTVLFAGEVLTDDPIADETISLLDGHIVLAREVAQRGVRPAIDILNSVSRLSNQLVSGEHRQIVEKINIIMKAYERNYSNLKKGDISDKTILQAEKIYEGKLMKFLSQGVNDPVPDFKASADRLFVDFKELILAQKPA